MLYLGIDNQLVITLTTMKQRGHQQDAEEFLGFLLEGLHDECAHVMQGQSNPVPVTNGTAPSSTEQVPPTADGWQEVGPKQKAALTRTAGQEEAPSPITKIFGGHLRSELRVPGLQTSAVYEPFKPLQLDIGAPDVNNIVDALKGLTRIESLDGQFGGRTNTAKKQVFIHDLPPVLILHLKRFQYDNNLTGTQKIWKKVGYPLELEIPKEVFAPAERKSLSAKGGLPRYRLNGVVYHHGKSAAGGHYTVDVLRQDGREWVRMDDTYIRRVRPGDVAQAGAEEDPKVLAKALADQQKSQADQADLPPKLRNPYQGLDDDPDDDADAHDESRPWSEVNGTNHTSSNSHGGSSANNITSTNNPTSASSSSNNMRKENVRDNKVAYILLYERIHS
jgi:ubiquitin carboxyl-terminal hydrolase 10